MKRTTRVAWPMTMEWVLAPPPKKRTPSRMSPSVIPVAAKTISFPGARSSVL